MKPDRFFSSETALEVSVLMLMNEETCASHKIPVFVLSKSPACLAYSPVLVTFSINVPRFIWYDCHLNRVVHSECNDTRLHSTDFDRQFIPIPFCCITVVSYLSPINFNTTLNSHSC